MKGCSKCRMIVIYTEDIRRDEVSVRYDIGALQIRIEPVFLSELDGDGIYSRLKEKVEADERLTDEELMETFLKSVTLNCFHKFAYGICYIYAIKARSNYALRKLKKSHP